MLREMERQLQREISRLEKEMREWLERERLSPLLRIEGEGVVSASYFVSELGEVKRLESARKVLSYLGLCPEVKESGGKRRERGAKRGKRWVKSALWMSAMRARREEGRMKEFLDEEGKRGEGIQGSDGAFDGEVGEGDVWGVEGNRGELDMLKNIYSCSNLRYTHH